MMYNGKRRKWWVMAPILFVAALLAMGWGVMVLWNGVFTEVAAVKAVSYWQALGLLALGRLLFGGWGGRGFGRRGHTWKSMEPEERMRMKAAWRKRCAERQGGAAGPGADAA
jgi:hypothetical protein